MSVGSTLFFCSGKESWGGKHENMNKKKKYTRLKIEKKNIPDWPPIVVAVDGHNGNFAETENEPKNETWPKK